MKKIVAMLLTAVLIGVMLAGCGKSAGTTEDKGTDTQVSTADTDKNADTAETSSGEKVELTMAWWGNQVRNDRTNTVLEMYMDQNPNVSIEGQFSEWSNYWTKLSTASAGDSLPDIIQHDYSMLSQYVDSDLLVDLSPYIESGVLDVSGIDEGLMQTGTFGSGVYAIPWTVNAPAMLYNKTMLDELGIEVHDNMNIDEFFDISKKVYEANGTKTHMGYLGGVTYIQYIMRGLGVEIFDGDKIGGTAEELSYYYKLHEDGLKEGWECDPSIFAERTIGSNEQVPLVYGSTPDARSWCVWGYSNQLTAMGRLSEEEGWEINITSIPSPDPVKSNYLKPSMFLSVSSDTKNPEEAVKVLNYLMNDVPCNEVLLCERGAPAVASVSQAIIPKLEPLDVLAIDYIKNVVSENCSQISPPNPAKADEATKLMDLLDEKVCYGEITAEEAGAQLLEEGTKILAGK